MSRHYLRDPVFWICTLLVCTVGLAWWGQHKLEAVIQQRLMQVAADANIGVGIRDISVSLFRLTPSIQLAGVSVGVPDNSLALSSTDVSASMSWFKIVTGSTTLDRVSVDQASIALIVDDSGRSNWDDLLSLAWSMRSKDNREPPLEGLSFGNVGLKYVNSWLDHDGNFRINGEVDLADTQSPSSLEITGDLNDYSVNVVTVIGGSDPKAQDFADSSLNPLPLLGIPLKIEANLADIILAMDAQTNSLLQPSQSTAWVRITGQNVTSVLHDLNLMKTDVAELSGELQLSTVNDVYQVSEASLTLGASDFAGSLLLDLAQQPALVSGQLSSNKLLIDEILGISAAPLNVKPRLAGDRQGVQQRFFSSQPFESDAWFSGLAGNVSANFKQIARGGIRIEDLDINSRFDADMLILDIDSEHFAGGSMEMGVELLASGDDVVGFRSGKLSLKMQQVQLLDVLSLTSASSSVGNGRLSGEGTFWFEGFSPSSLAGSVDGGLFFVIEDGELDSMLVEMAGIDLMETINLLIKRDLQQTSIRCGYVDVQAQSGKIDIEDLVIDTEDSLFLGSGGLDLNNESISLKFEPHPRDASFFAAPTALIVSGSLLSPVLRPGRSLYSRIAVASALAALSGPAAIVLPFIEIGRGGKPSNCTQLFSQ